MAHSPTAACGKRGSGPLSREALLEKQTSEVEEGCCPPACLPQKPAAGVGASGLLVATVAALVLLLCLRLGLGLRNSRGPDAAVALQQHLQPGGGTLHGGAAADDKPLTPADLAADLAAVGKLLAAWPKGKPKACYFILARNEDLDGVAHSVRQLERRFNRAARYPYIFINDKPFTEHFKREARALTSAPCFFGQVPPEHWTYPEHINTTMAAERRAAARGHMPYGGSESYRFMYFSGFFYRHPLLKGFDYYWRVEPDVYFYCDQQRDPFRHMHANKMSMAWTIMMREVPSTIPSLWPAVQQWLEKHPRYAAPNNALPAFLKEGPGGEQLFTGCHMWSNFEIGRLDFFRSESYRALFDHLDKAGGFFYERWGDAPVHTLAAAILMDRREIHWAEDIGYSHGSWAYCPKEPKMRRHCDCNTMWDAVPGAETSCFLDFQSRLASSTALPVAAATSL